MEGCGECRLSDTRSELLSALSPTSSRAGQQPPNLWVTTSSQGHGCSPGVPPISPSQLVVNELFLQQSLLSYPPEPWQQQHVTPSLPACPRERRGASVASREGGSGWLGARSRLLRLPACFSLSLRYPGTMRCGRERSVRVAQLPHVHLRVPSPKAVVVQGGEVTRSGRASSVTGKRLP